MTKKDEINKNNIIIGIATFAIIAIAIIAAFNFFIPKSHAQAQDFEKVARHTRNNVYVKSLKVVDKKELFKEADFQKLAVFEPVNFVNALDSFADKDQNHSALVLKDRDKASFTFAFARVKKWQKFPQAKSFMKDHNFRDNFKEEKMS